MKKFIVFLTIFFAAQLFAADFTVVQTAEQLAAKYGWVTGGFYGVFQLDPVVTIRANQPDTERKNGYYSPDDPRDWRVYQARNNGEFTVSVRYGYVIKSLCFKYGNKNNGVLSRMPGSQLEGANIVASGQVLPVNADSITFYAGNADTSHVGQVRISQFTVTYALIDSLTQVETFSHVTQKACNSRDTIWSGDYADWHVYNVRRSPKDTLNGDFQATWSKKDGYLKTTAEGGVKHLRFEWREFVDQPAELDLGILIGSDWRDTVHMSAIGDFPSSRNVRYNNEIGCKENGQLAFLNLSQDESGNTNRFLLGDIFITPYLYVPKQSRTWYFDQSDGHFDLKTIVLDNTDGEGTIVYSILSDETSGATIHGSVVDFSQSTASGAIQVQASWNDGKVVTSPITLNITTKEIGEVFTETFRSCRMSKQSGTTYVVGDEGVFGWNFSHFAREASDSIAGIQGTRIGYNGGVTMNGVQEGGIKSIAFQWRAKSTDKPVHFILNVDGEPYDCQYTIEESKGENQLYSRSFSIPRNTAMSVTIGEKESVAQSEIVLGAVEIMPYILFRTKLDTVVLADTTIYALDSVLINNTNSDAVYTILSDETSAATIRNGLLDLSQVDTDGKIRVQATWNQVTTTMTIYAQATVSGLNCISSTQPVACKRMVNGRLVIIHNGKPFSVLGYAL